MIVEHVVGHGPPPVSLRVERVVLGSADLARHRFRAVTDAGREIGISLPHGEHLQHGDLLYVDAAVVVMVEQAEEDLLVLRPESSEDFAKAGYHVGNLHRAAMIGPSGISVLYDRQIEALAGRLGIPFERKLGRFIPVPDAAGHSH